LFAFSPSPLPPPPPSSPLLPSQAEIIYLKIDL